MKHTNRVLSAVLAVVMLVLAFPVIVLPVSAAEPVMQEVTYMDYKDMYVQDGLTILLDAYDPSNVDLANGKWASEIGDAVVAVKGGVKSDSNKTGWYAASKGVKWDHIVSQVGTGLKINGLYFDLKDVPQGSYTVDSVISFAGIQNDDGSRFNNVYKYYYKTTTDPETGEVTKSTSRTAFDGNTYGNYTGEVFAFGPFRSCTWVNESLTWVEYGYDEATGKPTDEILSTVEKPDKIQSRWYYTGTKYTDHNTNFTGNAPGAGISLKSQDTALRNYSATDIINMSVTYALVGGNTYDTATSAIAGVTYNGTGWSATVKAGAITSPEKYATTLLPIDAGFTSKGVDSADRQYYQFMVGAAGTIYSLRVYDRALSAGEKSYNHFVDLCAYYDIKVPVLSGALTYAPVATEYADVSLGTLDEAGVAALQTKINNYAASAPKYLGLYVQDGLTVLYDAFNMNSVNLEKGTWAASIGTGIAAINGGVYDAESNITGWRASADGKGFYYVLKDEKTFNSNRNVGITFDATALNDGNFTVEYVFTPRYIAGEDGVIVPHVDDSISKWGAYAYSRSSFSVAGIQLCQFHPSTLGTGNNSAVRIFYSAKNGWGNNPNTTDYSDAKVLGNYSADAAANTLVTTPTALTITRTVTGGSVYNVVTATVSVSANGASQTYVNGSGTEEPTSSKPNQAFYTLNDIDKPFEGFYGTPATVYGVRAYDHVLSATEITQNKVVDILAMTGADVSALLEMTASHQAAILSICAPDMNYTMSKAEAQAVLDNALANTFLPDQSKDAYSDLYVQDGLTALYNAFDGGEKTVDLANGIWYATGSDGFIILNGDKWEKSNGGIGYRMLVSEWSGSTSSDYIDLGSLTSNDFTVEIAQTMVGLTTAEGERESITWEEGMDHKWGYYATKYSSYDFGYLKGTSFVAYVNTAGSGNLCTRISFNPGHWGDDNGKYWLSDFSWKDASYATVPVTYAYTQASGLFDREVPVYNMENKNTATEENPYKAFEGVTYVENGVKGYDLTVYENGNDVVAVNTVTSKYSGGSQYNRAVTYVDAEGAEQTGYIEYLSAAEAGVNVIGKAVKVMNSMPGDVYAIRMYDRALSAEEAAWNSLVDIAAYVGADVEVLAGIGDAQKASLGAAAAKANLSYASTADEVEAAIAQGLAYLATYAPEALGYQKGTDNTSLRIWATANLATVQGATALGMEIKVTGDAEKVLSGETDRVFRTVKSGDKVVCTEEADTFYFAAVVEGIPEDQNFTFTITPYAIVDGAKVYGKSVTLEWPAVENQA